MNETPRVQEPHQEVWQRPFVLAQQEWCGAFVLELRLRDVPGPVIGERLAEVERHCAESGETPAEAFGDPTSYARQIDTESSPERVSGVWTVAALGAAQVVALIVGTAATRTWAEGGVLTWNGVQVGCLALVLLVVLAVPRLVRPLITHTWVVGPAAVALVVLASLGSAVSGRFVTSSVLPVPAAVVAVGLFGVVVVLAWLEYRELANDDLVTSPLPPAAGDGGQQVRRRWNALVPTALVPVCYLALGAAPWFVG
ncbi:hypothetical protein [Blastococcus sp. SYSU DS1021]